MLRRFVRSKSGATSIEYAFIATLIGVVIISSVTLSGTKLNVIFTSVKNGFR